MIAAAAALVFAAFVSVLGLPSGAPAADAASGGYVVVLDGDSRVSSVLDRLGLTAEHTYASAFKGFSTTLTAAQRRATLADPTVASVIPDRMLADESRGGLARWNTDIKPPKLDDRQEIPTGVRRIGGQESPTADIDGSDDKRVNIDVAVIDDGVQLNHPDLNVHRHLNCFGRRYREETHGTHVAGTIAALDNDEGVVGVAPGARIWGIRVFNERGDTSLSAILCALDYVLDHADKIEVANLSAAFPGFDDGTCGVASDDPVHSSICEITDAGVTFVTAAGNFADDAANWAPVSYEQTIGVSALTDYDGAPGGLSEATCVPEEFAGKDDTFAVFSNYGADVDLIAPGVCILSTWPKPPGYEYWLGTSMATPHVSGAAALYLATHPDASPDDVKAALQASGDHTPVPGDPDAYPEPLVDVTGF